MTPQEWNHALRPGVSHVDAYAVVAKVARNYLTHSVMGEHALQTYELVEALYPINYAKQSDAGIAARKRISQALTKRALGTYALADCMTEAPEQFIPFLGCRGRPALWHAPRNVQRCDKCGQEIHP